VFVSADVIGMIIALFAFMVAVLGGVRGMLATQTKKLDERFDRIDARFERVEGEIADVRHQITGVKDELVEVKVAIARLEGPRPHLQRL
jgi:archaellum component FlaC